MVAILTGSHKMLFQFVQISIKYFKTYLLQMLISHSRPARSSSANIVKYAIWQICIDDKMNHIGNIIRLCNPTPFTEIKFADLASVWLGSQLAANQGPYQKHCYLSVYLRWLLLITWWSYLAVHSKLKEMLRHLESERTCKVCLSEEVSRAFRRCGHLCCCSSCATEVENCPICR